MRKISIGIGLATFVTLMMLMSAGAAMASEEVQVDWQNVNEIGVNVDDGSSFATLGGSADDLDGTFVASVSGRVEVDQATATFTDGGYMLESYNDFRGGYGEGFTTVRIEGSGLGDINAKTNTWDEGIQVKSYRHGTKPVTGATGDYAMSVSAFKDEVDDGKRNTVSWINSESFSVSADSSSGTGITQADPYDGSIVDMRHNDLSVDGFMEGQNPDYHFEFER